MKTVRYPADFKNLDAIRDFVGEMAQRAGFDKKEVYSIQLAADEACSNVIEHAYAGIPKGLLEVSCQIQDDGLTVIVHDHGKAFDLSTVREPNLGHELSEREIGGLGVYFIHKLMDEVHFESSAENGNTLTMLKRKSGKK